MSTDYQILTGLAIFCMYHLFKYINEPRDRRIELSREVFDTFVYCNNYHRYMRMSGIYDDDLDSDDTYKTWETEVKKLEETLPLNLKQQMGDYRDKYEILTEYKARD
jgi:hypothetical protein